MSGSWRVALLGLALSWWLLAHPATALAIGPDDPSSRTYLPLVAAGEPGCPSIPGESYGTLSPSSPPTDRPAQEHADLNLALRGYGPTTAYLGLVNYGGPADPAAPQLGGLFADGYVPGFVAVHRVYDWDWNCNCRSSLLAWPPVTLAWLAGSRGQIVRVPDSGYGIGSGYEVLVLHAEADRITLKYTREDSVVSGYAMHLEGICVEPGLLALYQHWNEAGRSRLPALHAGQAVGRARDAAIGVAIRDSGTFLDPRSRKDWWQGTQ